MICIPESESEPVLVDLAPFMRAARAVEFTVVEAPTADEISATDMFPPARVTDLRVVEASAANGTVTLRWTAPGDDFDVGRGIYTDR